MDQIVMAHLFFELDMLPQINWKKVQKTAMAAMAEVAVMTLK